LRQLLQKFHLQA